MPLGRALTMRRSKQQSPPTISAPTMQPGRAASTRNGRPINRKQISLPVELISTTNVLSYSAPDIAGTYPIGIRHVSSESSNTDVSSDSEDITSGRSTPMVGDDEMPHLTDASSIDESESPLSPEDVEGPAPNHLSCYFKPAVETSIPSRSPSLRSSRPTSESPQLPQRAPSHSKRAHERVNRKRSMQRMLSPTRDIVRSSLDMFNSSKDFPSRCSSPALPSSPELDVQNPFGKELAQLDAVVEEFGHVVLDAEDDADRQYLESKGLACHGAGEYMDEIKDLIVVTFADDGTEIDSWI